MTTRLEKVLYTAQAHTTGGREGRSVSSDGLLDVRLAPPKELGGMGGATNPEQLFAAGYSACFMGALKHVASLKKVVVPADAAIDALKGEDKFKGKPLRGLTIRRQAEYRQCMGETP